MKPRAFLPALMALALPLLAACGAAGIAIGYPPDGAAPLRLLFPF